MRPTTSTYLLDIAAVVATRSTCARLAVGAVLARDGRILSTGYNGAPAGMPHCVHVDDEPCRAAVHAEANALVFAARHGAATAGATLYATHAPCATCAALIINAGVRAVTYRDPYRSSAGRALLNAAGIPCRSALPDQPEEVPGAAARR